MTQPGTTFFPTIFGLSSVPMQVDCPCARQCARSASGATGVRARSRAAPTGRRRGRGPSSGQGLIHQSSSVLVKFNKLILIRIWASRFRQICI